jgi:hypothetical protein
VALVVEDLEETLVDNAVKGSKSLRIKVNYLLEEIANGVEKKLK